MHGWKGVHLAHSPPPPLFLPRWLSLQQKSYNAGTRSIELLVRDLPGHVHRRAYVRTTYLPTYLHTDMHTYMHTYMNGWYVVLVPPWGSNDPVMGRQAGRGITHARMGQPGGFVSLPSPIGPRNSLALCLQYCVVLTIVG